MDKPIRARLLIPLIAVLLALGVLQLKQKYFAGNNGYWLFGVFGLWSIMKCLQK